MSSPTDHPQGKPPEPDDPHVLRGTGVVGGDPLVMLRSIVEEYARMGWAEEQLMPLFTDPVYRTCALGRRFGEARVREVVRETLARCGVARVQVTTRPEDAR